LLLKFRCAVFALVLSFAWLYLVQWFAGFIVWITLIASTIISIGLTVLIWVSWWQVKQGNQDDAFIVDYIPSGQDNATILLVLGACEQSYT
jgi:hypothetical protein